MQTTEDATPPHSLADWKVLFPYWKSEEKWWAWSLLGGTIGLSVLYVQSAVWFGAWYHRFFDAFFAGEVGRCLGMLPFYLLVTLGSVVVHATQTYLTQVLSMRWRLWNTKVYLRQYLSEEAYYRLEHGPNRADNPDQRIADDLSQMTVQTLKLGLDAIDAVTTLLSFAVVLWNIGGVLSFDWHGRHFQIPGYLFLGAVLTSLLASGILERFGAPLIGANYRQQHFDADLRAGLMDVRRNSEQIAFYGGENAEQLRLSGYLTHIAMNWRSVVRYTWRVNFISEFYTGVTTIPLWLMLAPKAMAHALSFGLYSQINSAYTQVQISLEWFIFNYADLATLRSVLQRLGEFERVVIQPSESGIVRFAIETPAVQIRDLVLNLPDGKPIVQIGDLTMQGGERWLVRGPSGSGKSTFLRALAGLWRHGRGGGGLFQHPTITTPPPASRLWKPSIWRDTAIGWTRLRTGARCFLRASSSVWPWRGRCCSGLRSCFWTRRRLRWMTPTSVVFTRPFFSFCPTPHASALRIMMRCVFFMIARLFSGVEKLLFLYLKNRGVGYISCGASLPLP
ncbi:ABC transporter ATP-binding protein/permease [Gluconobacter kondonii]